MSAKHEARELAYSVWRECGQNLSECERILNRDRGLPVSRQTLTEWAQKYDWKVRAARVEAVEAEVDDAVSDYGLLKSLLAQKKRYEAYFESLDPSAIDNQAMYAYNGVLKNLVELRRLNDAARQLMKTLSDADGKPHDAALRDLITLIISMASTGLAVGTVGIKDIDLSKLLAACPSKEPVADEADLEKPCAAEPDKKSRKELAEEVLTKIRRDVYGLD